MFFWGVAVLTISDKCSGGNKEDKSGKIAQDLIKGLPGEVAKYEIIPDELERIKERLVFYSDTLKVNLVLTTGGTGFTPRDFTPEATRTEGLKFTKKAMLSRGVSGIRGKILIINLPGSSPGAQESLEAILSGLAHGLDMIVEKQH